MGVDCCASTLLGRVKFAAGAPAEATSTLTIGYFDPAAAASSLCCCAMRGARPVASRAPASTVVPSRTAGDFQAELLGGSAGVVVGSFSSSVFMASIIWLRRVLRRGER